MKDAEPPLSGWGSSATMPPPPPPPPPTTVPPTPPASSGFTLSLRTKLPERKPSQSDSSGWNASASKPSPITSTFNPLKRKFDEPPTPTTPSVSIDSNNSNVPCPHSEAAINAAKQRLKAEDEVSAESRSSSEGLLRDSPSESGEVKRKEARPVSKMKRGKTLKVWHNHIKYAGLLVQVQKLKFIRHFL